MGPTDFPRWSAPDAPENTAAGFAKAAIERLFEISPDGIVVTDKSGTIREVNQRACELFGYTRVELVGQPIEMLVPARFRGRHPHHREQYKVNPRARQMGASLNLWALRKDGSEFPVDIMLKPIAAEDGDGVLSFVRDVTEQHEAQELLQANDARLRSIVESVSEYAIYMLDERGNVLTWNTGAARIKGYTPEEIVGQNFSRFFCDEDLDRNHPAELLRLAAQNGRVEEEGWRLRKDGSRFWANVVLTAIHDSNGALSGYAKVTRDVTESRNALESIIAELSSVLLANVDIRKLLSAFSVSMKQIVPHDLATLALLDDLPGQLRVQYLSADGKSSAPDQDVLVDINTSPAGEAYRTRQPVIVSKLIAWPLSRESVSHLIDAEMQSAVWVPLIHRERTLGTIAAASRMENAFDRHDAEQLANVAGHVAMAVNNAIAFKQIAELRERARQEREYLKEEINLENNFDDIVGESTGLRSVLRQIETVAPTSATVLIQGETGTGKELLARAIHNLSPRAERTFIKLNCAAIPAGLLESELFGHEKGAFTGAISRKIGRLELAHEGTLFLDEVGEMPLDLQPKLLRALQEREIERLGGTRAIAVDVRLIAATNRDLAKMVAEKQFRSDLFYRLKVFPVFAPPLRERTGDIPILVRHFVDRHSRRMGKTIESIPEEAMEALCAWKWPGNIRELENFLERAVILTKGRTLYVPLTELEDIDDESEEDDRDSASDTNPTLQAAERELIVRALREARGMIGGPNGAAGRLGLKRTTLNSKIKKLGIERKEYL